jgi:hypothetical protein
MTTLKDLRRTLLTELASELSTKGFKYEKPQTYYRATSATRESLHIGFINHKADFDVVVYVTVRFRHIIDVLDQFTTGLDNQEKIRIASVGNELGNLSQGAQRRWTVSSETDIPAVRSSIISAIETVAVPYWERFPSLDDVLAVTSGDDRASWIHSPFDDIRAKTAILAAFALGKKDEFDDLVKRKFQLLRDREDLDFQSISRLANALATSWPEQSV